MRRAVLLIAALAAGLAAAQDSVLAAKQVVAAQDAYMKCIIGKARSYARTKELPADIAEASIGACAREQSQLYVAHAALGVGRQFAETDATARALLVTFEKGARRAAIAVIFSSRYPEL